MRASCGYIRVEPVRKLRLLTLGVNHEPGAVKDLRLIWSLGPNRDPFRVPDPLNVQGATQAKDADQRNVAVQHCRSLKRDCRRSYALAHLRKLSFSQPINRPYTSLPLSGDER
jgi:hypothetical protein